MVVPSRYYEDLETGATLVSSSKTVSTDEIVEFASRYDPQYFHTDPDAARNHPQFGDIVASGIHILAVWRQLDHLIMGDIHWICGIEWKNLRWNTPMRGGDTVRARAEISGKRESSKRASRGIVEVRYSLLNQRDEEIFQCMSTNLVERRPVVQAAKGQ